MSNKWIFIKSNIRKKLSSIITIFVMMVLSIIIINLTFCIALDFKNDFYNVMDKLNGEESVSIVQVANDDDVALISDYLDSSSVVKDYEIDRTVSAMSTTKYGKGTMQHRYSFVSYNDAKNKRIGKYEFIEGEMTNNGYEVFLPLDYKLRGGYNIGDEIEFTVYIFPFSAYVAGFYDACATGTINCTDLVIICNESFYQMLVDESFIEYVRVLTIYNNKETLDVDCAKLSKEISNLNEDIQVICANTISTYSQSRYIIETIIAAMLEVASIVFSLLLFVVIGNNLSNYIKDNIKNLGTLKANGYTGKSLFASLVIEFICIAIIALGVGIPLSYLAFNPIAKVMVGQTGLTYTVKFLPIPAVITSVLMLLLVFCTTALSSRKILYIEPILAIREAKNKEKHTSSFNLDKSRLGLDLSLAFKKSISNLKKNSIVFLTMIIIGITMIAACFMEQNISRDVDTLALTVFGQRGTLCATVYNNESVIDNFKEELDKNGNVTNYFAFDLQEVFIENGEEISALLIEPDQVLSNEGMFVEGRKPQTSSEIALNATYANKNGYEIGDMISVANSGDYYEFEIVGFTQMVRYVGNDCVLTVDGFKKLGISMLIQYYVTVEGITKEEAREFILDIPFVLTTTDVDELIETSKNSYAGVMKYASLIIVILSLLLMIFVLYILVNNQMDDSKKENGILKSIGFVSRQLMMQLTLSFMPVIILGFIIGMGIGELIMEDLFLALVSGLGFVHIGRPVEFVYLAISLGIIFVVSFSFILLQTRKIKYITPHKLFTNE